MKGCIIKNDEISIKDICNIIGDVDNYNWLITNIECYPSDEEIVKILDNEYCWIEGRSLLDLLAKEEFQWIWGVFSAFPKEIRLEEVLKYDYPYADGYKDLGKSNSIATSISSFRNCGLGWFINISNIEKSEVVNALIENNTFAQDLEKYNME